jgi:hypothetical protein
MQRRDSIVQYTIDCLLGLGERMGLYRELVHVSADEDAILVIPPAACTYSWQLGATKEGLNRRVPPPPPQGPEPRPAHGGVCVCVYKETHRAASTQGTLRARMYARSMSSSSTCTGARAFASPAHARTPVCIRCARTLDPTALAAASRLTLSSSSRIYYAHPACLTALDSLPVDSSANFDITSSSPSFK